MCTLRVCLGIKRSTKLQISKSTPKGDISGGGGGGGGGGGYLISSDDGSIKL